MNASFPAPPGAPSAPLSLAPGGIRKSSILPLAVLAFGCLAVAVPTLLYVAREGWSSEQGGHGPIVMMTGLWLLWRLWPAAVPHFRQPPVWRVALILLVLVPAYFVARVTHIIEIEGLMMYGLLLAALYSATGGRALRTLWFPLFYLAFIFPPPNTIVFFMTMPLKSLISHAAVGLLSAFGYPIGGAGVMIVIGQYELLVAAACSGLNSIISLSALSLFYVYIRHQADPLYALLLVIAIIPIALLANFIRVLILILLTYYGGDAVGQGFMHYFAGMVMFVLALGTVFFFDLIAMHLWNHIFRPLHRDQLLLSGKLPVEALGVVE